MKSSIGMSPAHFAVPPIRFSTRLLLTIRAAVCSCVLTATIAMSVRPLRNLPKRRLQNEPVERRPPAKGPKPRKILRRDRGLPGYQFVGVAGRSVGDRRQIRSGKTTLLNCMSARLEPTNGSVEYRPSKGEPIDLYGMSEASRAVFLMRTDWGSSIKIRATDRGWRSARAGNIGERLMAVGERHYGEIRQSASDWLERVEFDLGRIDHMPTTFSEGCSNGCRLPGNL